MALQAHSHRIMNDPPASESSTSGAASSKETPNKPPASQSSTIGDASSKDAPIKPSGETNSQTSAQAPNTPSTQNLITNTLGGLSTKDTIVDKEPYDVSRCDQVIMLNAQRIPNIEDYTSRAPAFFTLSAYMLNMFESKDNNKLLESISLSHIKQLPVQLKGSKNCMIFKDSVNHRSITMCIDSPTVFDQIEKTYSDLMTCRVGGDLKKFDPATINSILTASCNGYSKTEGVEFDLPKIRSQINEELTKAGFIVTDTTISGSTGFELNNSNIPSVDSTPTKKARKIDYTVPGTSKEIIKKKKLNK